MSIRLEIRHLEVLIAVKDQPSLTLAAARLGVTQSALSHRIREAERRLGAALCERHNRSLRLTPQGERIVTSARGLLQQLKRVECEIELDRLGISHQLMIGSRAYGCYRWLPKFLRYFQGREPRTSVEFFDDAATRPFEALQANLVDVSILSGTARSKGIERVHLFRDQLYAIVPPDHPKAGAPYLTHSDFAGEVYVTYSASPERGHEWDQLFIHQGFNPERIITAGLIDAVIELVHSGFGISIIAGWAARPYADVGYVKAIPVTQRGLSLDWYAAYRATGERNSSARKFAKSLATWCRNSGDTIGYQPLASRDHEGMRRSKRPGSAVARAG